jgi:hypothetical protein
MSIRKLLINHRHAHAPTSAMAAHQQLVRSVKIKDALKALLLPRGFRSLYTHNVLLYKENYNKNI